MKSFLKEKGMLTLSIGEGYLSAYEVSVLKPGDIVNSSRLAGEGYAVYFNDRHLFTSEVVIIDKVFGLRVTTFVPPKSSFDVFTNLDDPIEILPIMIRLGSIELALSDLKGVGPGTIISLDKPYNDEEDAELLVAGIPVAQGKVGATYENMHLRITKVYDNSAENTDIEVRSSGSLLEHGYSTKSAKIIILSDQISFPAMR